MQQRTETPDKTNTGQPTVGPQPFDGPDKTNTGADTTHQNQPPASPPMKLNPADKS
jgi:hypothetical protein